MVRFQHLLDIHSELIVDNFAGGGGASTGIEMALGRHVDVAINHDPLAVALHSANHPQTHHHCEDVFKVDPIKATGARPVGLAWFSPDCKDFSKAKGGKPRSKRIRGLAWIVIKWAKLVRPRVIILENVEEFSQWGPLLPDGTRCPKRKGNTFKYWVRKLRRYGYEVEWRELRACDYGAPTIRKRLYLIARCDGKPIVWPCATHGDPSQEGFRRSKLAPWRTAAECIDWTLPCPSIFLTSEEAKKLGVKRPLAEATQRRIARGIKKFVLEAKEPFIIRVDQTSGRPERKGVHSTRSPINTIHSANAFALTAPFVTPLTHQGGDRVEDIHDPFRTITGAHRGEKALTMPFVVPQQRFEDTKEDSANKPIRTITAYGGRCFRVAVPVISDANRPMEARNASPKEPMRTQMAEVKGGHFQLVQAFLAKHYGGVVGTRLPKPLSTVTSVDHHSLVAAHLESLYSDKGQQTCRASSLKQPIKTVTATPRHALFASHLSKLYGTTTGQEADAPLHTITGQGNHIAEVRAFLIKYYSEGGQDQDLREPIHTIPTVDRFGIVTIEGQDYQISDIGMRMLVPRELYRGQGFPDTYTIEIQIDVVSKKGKVKRKRLSNEAQVRMCGNSVCPPVAMALVAANVPELSAWRNGEKKQFDRLLKILNRPQLQTV